MNKIRVLVCDDQPDIVSFFCDILNSQSDITVVATANNGAQALELTEQVHPDVVLMDIQMETEFAGIQAIEKISEKHPDIKCVMLTVHESNDLIISAYLAGAVDYIIKTTNEDDICQSIRNSYSSNNYMGKLINDNLKSEFHKIRSTKDSLLFVINKISKLTPSELDILHGICLGQKQREIAEDKHVEISTIKFHVHNILKKLDFKNTKDMYKTLNALEIFNIIWPTQ